MMKTTPTPADGSEAHTSVTPAGERRADSTKPLTVMLSEDLLRRLKVIAVLKDTSVSEIVAEHIEAVVRRDLKRVLAKLEG